MMTRPSFSATPPDSLQMAAWFRSFFRLRNLVGQDLSGNKYYEAEALTPVARMVTY